MGRCIQIWILTTLVWPFYGRQTHKWACGLLYFDLTQNTFSADHYVEGQRSLLNDYQRKNIAKGTTDPRVEFISQLHSSEFINLYQITITIREPVKNVLADFVR